MDMLNLAELKRRRERLGLSQGEASRRAGFKSIQHWNNIEAGKRSNVELQTLYAMAAALECQPADLLLPATARGKRK